MKKEVSRDHVGRTMIPENEKRQRKENEMNDSKTKASDSEAKTFIEALFHPLDENEQIELRYRHPRSGQLMRRKFLNSTGSAYRQAELLGMNCDVYVGVAPRRGKLGTKAGVSRINFLWADVDKRKAESGVDLFSQIMQLECYPSMVINSGGGFHPYWRLERPARTEQELLRSEKVMKALAGAIGGDPVHDRSRILRVPGTLNHKYDVPRKVRLTFEDNQVRYSLEELEEMVASLGFSRDLTSSSPTGSTNTDVLSGEIGDGVRNLALTSVAGSLRNRGCEIHLINEVLQTINERRCCPPLPKEEVYRIAKSVCRYEVGTPKYRDSSAKRIFGKGGS